MSKVSMAVLNLQVKLQMPLRLQNFLYSSLPKIQINQSGQKERFFWLKNITSKYFLYELMILGENGGYPPTKNGDIRSLLCA